MAKQETTPRVTGGLPESVASFLVELARALQRSGMYPPGHPAREKTAGTVCDNFRGLAETIGEVRLEIAPDHLVFGEAATDPAQTVLAGMAARLYQHHLLSITILPGLDQGELADLLGAVSVAIGATGKPLGSEPAEELNRWPHVRLEPIPFESLGFSVGDSSGGGSGAGGSVVGGDAVQEGEVATAAAEETAKPSGAGTGLEEEKSAEPVSESVRQKIARLILKLDTNDLRGLVQKIEQTRAADGTEDEVASAVSELLQAAESGRLSEPSEALLKLVTKMGIHGGAQAEQEGAGSVGDSVGIGELVKQLGGDWNLDDPSPKDYKAALANLSTQAAVLGSNPIWIEKPEPERMLQLAVELDDTGPQVEIAVNAMLEEGRIGDVITMLEEAPVGVEHIPVFWGLVATPENILSLLRKEPPDFETIDRLIPRLAESAAEPLVEMLGEVESGSRASAIADRVVRLGPGIRRYAVDRLGDERWHVRRNMLALLSRFEDLPEDFTPAPYLVDPDPRVRRAAMRLGLAAWSEVETVMVAALEDSDPQIVELGIEAAKKHCPPLVVPYLEMIALDEKVASPFRVGAIQALASSGTPGALPMLLKLAWVRKFFLIRGLADKSSELMAVLAAINERWAEDHAAARVLRAARKSKDPQIRAVVKVKGGQE